MVFCQKKNSDQILVPCAAVGVAEAGLGDAAVKVGVAVSVDAAAKVVSDAVELADAVVEAVVLAKMENPVNPAEAIS